MKVIFFILGLVVAARAQNCDNTFGTYLNALKDETASSASVERDLEVENRDDYFTLVRQCFATSRDDPNKCGLTDDELKGDVYSDDGPMKGCERCQKMARGLRDKYMNSAESVRKCFRSHFAQAIREELEPCIQGKISNGYQFHVPEIPDFDEKTFNNIDIAEKAVNYRIVSRSRLDACQSVNRGKYGNTQPCMEKGYSGMFAKHCQAAKNAKTKALSSQSGCSSRFDEVKSATCQCMDDKRNDWHDRFAKIQKIVSEATSGSSCGQQISDVIGSWLSKIQKTLDECLPKTAETQGKTDLHTLIELGCGQVINGGVKKNELTVGFRFVRLFLDALNDRITIFCNKNCSF
jgi:hypothetical protein